MISSLFSIPLKRWAKLLAGLAFVGVGIAFMKQANLGLGPWDVLNDGLAQLTGIRLGTASIIIGALVLLFWIPFREKPGVGTLTNTVLIGAFTDISLAVVRSVSGLLLQSVWLIAGLLLAGLGSVLYLGSGLGAGPRDGLMLGLSRKTGWSLHLTRTALEISVLIAGWFLGGAVGVGTVLIALAIGPVIQFISRMTGEELGMGNRLDANAQPCCG
ncbi:MAG TPA: hypothetical protein VJS44_19690 [Pyrinomonadaceae bacterium]|nr:hypothetical protein [Pyrinomonadaceae bacterium]